MQIRLLCTIILMINLPSFAQDSSANKGDLIVLVNGFDNNEGKAMIALSNTQNDYETEDEPYRGAMAPITDNKSVWTFDNLAFGTYAIKVFHDEDRDDELDTNFLGMPSEDYGFSNNARGSFGPASWEDAKFIFESKSDTIIIEIE